MTDTDPTQAATDPEDYYQRADRAERLLAETQAALRAANTRADEAERNTERWRRAAREVRRIEAARAEKAERQVAAVRALCHAAEADPGMYLNLRDVLRALDSAQPPQDTPGWCACGAGAGGHLASDHLRPVPAAPRGACMTCDGKGVVRWGSGEDDSAACPACGPAAPQDTATPDSQETP